MVNMISLTHQEFCYQGQTIYQIVHVIIKLVIIHLIQPFYIPLVLTCDREKSSFVKIICGHVTICQTYYRKKSAELLARSVFVFASLPFKISSIFTTDMIYLYVKWQTGLFLIWSGMPLINVITSLLNEGGHNPYYKSTCFYTNKSKKKTTKTAHYYNSL